MPVLLELYECERRHLVAVTTAALSAGIEERRVQMAEQQGALVAGVISRALSGILSRLIELGLAEELRAQLPVMVGEVVPRELRALASGDGR